MNILRAINSKGTLLIGVGENGAECAGAIWASANRANVEACELLDLRQWLGCVLAIEHLLPENDTGHSESEYWRYSLR